MHRSCTRYESGFRRMKRILLKHYTNIGDLRLILQNGFFLSDAQSNDAKKWDDQNDVEMLKLFHDETAKFPYILCLTPTTSIHHWSYYGQTSHQPKNKRDKYDSIKCSIGIDYTELDKYINENCTQGEPYMELKVVKYYSLSKLQGRHPKINVNDIPFIKKAGYSVDREVRLLLISNKQLEATSKERHLKEILPFVSQVTFYITKKDEGINEKEVRKYLKSLLGPNIKVMRSKISYSKEWCDEIKKNII